MTMSDFEIVDRPHLLSPLVLAYIGDAVYELWVRRRVVARGCVRTGQMHGESVKYVSASAQAGILRSIEGMLTGEESAIARRGRNASNSRIPRSAGAVEYRHSTGLECLVGYLFLKGDNDRLAEIMEKAFEIVENEAQV